MTIPPAAEAMGRLPQSRQRINRMPIIFFMGVTPLISRDFSKAEYRSPAAGAYDEMGRTRPYYIILYFTGPLYFKYKLVLQYTSCRVNQQVISTTNPSVDLKKAVASVCRFMVK
jgi:hypothetical protein